MKIASSPYINRFLQPDTIVPNLYNPQYLNRFSYVRNNPIRYSDPTGHMDWEGEGGDYTLPDLDPGDYCDTHLGACSGSDNSGELIEVTGGLYVGVNYPESLLDQQDDIYEGAPIDLLDSISQNANNINISSYSNVFTTLYLWEDFNGVIEIRGIRVVNYSDFRVTVSQVLIEATGDPAGKLLTPDLAKDQNYRPNPLRYAPFGTNGLLAVNSGDAGHILLTPSGNPANINNRFNPSYTQKLKVTVYFRFTPNPRFDWNIFNIIP